MRVAYGVLQVRDVDASLHFYEELLGLRLTLRDGDVAYLKGWEERQHHSLVLRKADTPAVERLGFRVRTDHDLDLLADWYAERGGTVRMGDADLRGMTGRTLRVWDHLGTPLEFYVAMELLPSVLQDYHLHRGAPIMRFDHVNLHSSRARGGARALAAARVPLLGVHLHRLRARARDRRVDAAQAARSTTSRSPPARARACTTSRCGSPSPTASCASCDQLGGAHWTHAIERGPGRHGVSNAFFVYLRDPDGHRLELYTCDYYTGDPDHVPLRWSVNDPRCRSFWGTRAPDSWYDESSTLLGPDGEPVATTEATVDERDQHSEVMA